MLTSPVAPIAAEAQSQKSPGTVEDKEGVGTIAWTNPNNAKASDNTYATSAVTSAAVTHYLQTKSHGFALPESATVLGIIVEVERSNPELATKQNLVDSTVKLAKAGEPGGTNKAKPGIWEETDVLVSYGGSDDLWGQTWTASEINAAGFGAAFSCKGVGGETTTARVDFMRITVYYTEAADENRVCFATRSIELRSDGCFRQHPTDDVWGRLVPYGFLPYAPPSGMEGRKMRIMVVPSQGDFGEEPDSGSNKMALQIFYRPAYHFAREAAP
jgi:hypothetical protein